jgi:hypothetical protein
MYTRLVLKLHKWNFSLHGRASRGEEGLWCYDKKTQKYSQSLEMAAANGAIYRYEQFLSIVCLCVHIHNIMMGWREREGGSVTFNWRS